MKVGVCVFAPLSGYFPPPLHQTGFTFPVGGHPILRQQRLSTSGGRKNLHGSLCQYLEKEGCPWTERWDLALLLLCQSYAEPNRRASEKKYRYLSEDSLWGLRHRIVAFP